MERRKSLPWVTHMHENSVRSSLDQPSDVLVRWRQVTVTVTDESPADEGFKVTLLQENFENRRDKPETELYRVPVRRFR